MVETRRRPQTSGLGMWATCAVLGLLQLLLGGHIDLFGAAPDFLFALTCLVAFVYGSRAGCVAGFVCGLTFDLLGAGPVGVSALLGCVAGYALALGGRSLVSEGVGEVAPVYCAAAFAYNVLTMVLLAVLGTGVELCWAAVGRVLAATALDVAVGLAAFAVARRCVKPQGISSGGFHLS